MTYNEINREGLEQEIGSPLTETEWDNFLREVNKFVELAEPTQEELDDFIVALADDFYLLTTTDLRDVRPL